MRYAYGSCLVCAIYLYYNIWSDVKIVRLGDLGRLVFFVSSILDSYDYNDNAREFYSTK